GPLAVPPPRRLLVLLVPTRALPVPFCRNNFLVLPETSPRRKVECVPARRLARYMSTTSCRSCLLILPPNSAGSTSRVPTVWPWPLYTFRLKGASFCWVVATVSPKNKPLGVEKTKPRPTRRFRRTWVPP